MKRLLLVDRDLKTVEQLRDPLEARSFDVEIALSGEIGLQILEQRRIDAVLLSVAEDQEEDPRVFVVGLRERFPDVPVVLVTEGEDVPDLAPEIGAALRASHRKPLSLDGLLADIEAACGA
jgi:DNA-binding response OmpR family regulator